MHGQAYNTPAERRRLSAVTVVRWREFAGYGSACRVAVHAEVDLPGQLLELDWLLAPVRRRQHAQVFGTWDYWGKFGGW